MPDLMKHQRECIEFFRGKTCGAILLDRGTGKTAAILCLLDERMDDGQRVLYVAIKSTLHQVAQECERFTPRLTPIVLDGTKKKKLDLLRRLKVNPPARALAIVNFESLRTIAIELAAVGWSALVLDEVTRCKDRRTQQSKAAKLISRHCASRWMMTGYPVTEGIEDAWSEYDIIGNGKILPPNFFAFRNRFCVMGGYDRREVVAYKNVDEFVQLIRPHSFARTKAECLDLPPKVYQTMETEMCPAQWKVYTEIQEHLRIQFDEGTLTVTAALAEMQKLMQVASGFVYRDDGTPEFFDNEKTAALQELLETTRGKVVVFTNFKAERNRLEQHLSRTLKGKFPCVMITAEHPSQERTRLQTLFNDDPEQRVFLCDVRVGGVGLNLAPANTVVFHSLPLSLELNVQAEDRCFRKGSEIHDKVTIVRLLAKDTIDEKVARAIIDKRKMADAIVEGVLGVQGALDRIRQIGRMRAPEDSPREHPSTPAGSG